MSVAKVLATCVTDSAFFQGAAERVRRAHGKPMQSAFAQSMITTWAWANAFRPSLGVRNADWRVVSGRQGKQQVE
jgi:hypothetical protein